MKPSTAAIVFKLHDDGMSWGHIARIFGVSSRTVHQWAVGGAMSPGRERFLISVVAAFESLDEIPEERFVTLFENKGGQPSIIDGLRFAAGITDQIINPPNWSATDFFGTAQQTTLE